MNFRGLPMGLIGMVVLVATTEALIGNHADEFSSDIAATWRWSKRSALRDLKNVDILCLGDSIVKYGVVPRVIEKRTGLKVHNLAVLYGNAPTSYFLLRKALASGAKPSTILINGELNPIDPINIPKFWAELATPAEAAELAWTSRDPIFFASYLASKAFPSIKARDEIRARIVKSLAGQVSDAAFCHALNQRNWRYNKGAAIVPSSCTTSVDHLKKLDDNSGLPSFWKCHPLNLIYLKKILDLSGVNQIKIIWIISPQHPAYEKQFRRPDWNGLQRQFAYDLTVRYANLFVIDGHGSNYDGKVLFDLAHLNRRGACAFSESLGDVIRDRLPSGATSDRRWIQIPHFSESGEADVEDIYQSMAIIQNEWRTLRR